MAEGREEGVGRPSLTGDEAVDLGLYYGRVSGQRKSCDEVHYQQKYVPRRPRSRWSQVNVAKAGRADRSRADAAARPGRGRDRESRWQVGRLQSQRNATVPPDLAAALAASPRAALAFEAVSKTERYAVILKLATARTATSRVAYLR